MTHDPQGDSASQAAHDAGQGATEDDYDAIRFAIVMAYREMLGQRIRERRVRDRMPQVEEWIAAHGVSAEFADAARRSARAHAEGVHTFSVGEYMAEMDRYITERENAGEDTDAIMHELLAEGQAWALR